MFVDFPALQLPRIKHRHSVRRFNRGKLLWFPAGQNLKDQPGCFLAVQA